MRCQLDPQRIEQQESKKIPRIFKTDFFRSGFTTVLVELSIHITTPLPIPLLSKFSPDLDIPYISPIPQQLPPSVEMVYTTHSLVLVVILNTMVLLTPVHASWPSISRVAKSSSTRYMSTHRPVNLIRAQFHIPTMLMPFCLLELMNRFRSRRSISNLKSHRTTMSLPSVQPEETRSLMVSAPWNIPFPELQL